MKYGGLKNAWVHSDDIFVYGLNPRTTKNMQPNREAIEELFKGIMETGIEHTNPTHGTLVVQLQTRNLSQSFPDNQGWTSESYWRSVWTRNREYKINWEIRRQKVSPL